MLKIVGVQRKTGKYEGYDYDNINLHCVETALSEKSVLPRPREVTVMQVNLWKAYAATKAVQHTGEAGTIFLTDTSASV